MNITDIPKILLLFLLFSFTYLFVRDNRENTKNRLIEILKHKKWTLAFFLYLAAIITVTIISRTQTNPYQNILKYYGLIIDVKINEDAIKNLLLFIPYTFLFIQAFHPVYPLKTALLLSIITTCFIELTQLIFWLGFFQFEDILHNIISGLMGWALWWIIKRIRKKAMRKSIISNKKNDC